MPLVIDTDIGGDPDDAVALVIAAGLAELALVVTCDEHDGRRARLARHLLDALGRDDVPVAAGRDLGNRQYWSADGLVPPSVPRQPADVAAEVVKIVESAGGPVRWLGIGPMSNLADLLAGHPDLPSNLEVTLMGGALRYRHPDRAEHNIRLDVDAARSVLAAGLRPWLVPSDVTFMPENELTRESSEYQLLTGDDRPAWAAILREHLDGWFADFHPGTMQHDAMALSLAMRLPFLDVDRTRVRLDAIGRLHEDPDGHEVLLARNADYVAFRAWLSARLEDQLQRA